MQEFRSRELTRPLSNRRGSRLPPRERIGRIDLHRPAGDAVLLQEHIQGNRADPHAALAEEVAAGLEFSILDFRFGIVRCHLT